MTDRVSTEKGDAESREGAQTEVGGSKSRKSSSSSRRKCH